MGGAFTILLECWYITTGLLLTLFHCVTEHFIVSRRQLSSIDLCDPIILSKLIRQPVVHVEVNKTSFHLASTAAAVKEVKDVGAGQ